VSRRTIQRRVRWASSHFAPRARTAAGAFRVYDAAELPKK
jgi:hypothetical protein